MKRIMKRWIAIAFTLAAPIAAMAQISVYHIDNETVPQTQQGVFYALPRTVVNINVRIDRIENYKGPYSDYAARYLGLKNVVSANSVQYKIRDIVITTSGEPDPEQYYFIETGEKMSKGEKTGLLSLSESGLILGTIPHAVDTTVRLVIPEEMQKELSIEEKDIFPEIFKYSADMSVFEKVDTIIRKVNIDTVTLERQYLKRTMVEKSPEQKAREAADFITKIKDNRFNLISGYQEVNYNKETLEYMDEQLTLLEKEYMKLFTGISIHKTLNFTYKYIPLKNQINTEIPIFKFNPAKGVQDLDSPGGNVITIRIQRVGNTNNVADYLNRAQKVSKTNGFFYRIPELARVTVKLDDGSTEETQCLVSQLGVVTYLPANKWKVDFYRETGSIKGVVVE